MKDGRKVVLVEKLCSEYEAQPLSSDRPGYYRWEVHTAAEGHITLDARSKDIPDGIVVVRPRYPGSRKYIICEDENE